MSLETPAGLVASVENLRGALLDLMRQVEGIRGDVATLKAVSTSHTHDYTRDITGKPSAASVPAHTHPWDTGITGKPATYAPTLHGNEAHTSTFITSSHTHTEYAANSHTHDYAASTHTHNYAAATHTHNYAGPNHVHDYDDAMPKDLSNTDVVYRITGPAST